MYLMLPGPLQAQVGIPDTVQTEQTQPDSTEEVYEIAPWDYAHRLNAEIVASDSTLRWENWPDWTFKKNRDFGAVSHRLGTIWRNSGLTIGAHEQRHQQLFFEDLPAADPVSGMVLWNLMPHLKIGEIAESNRGLTHNSEYHIKQYYLNKPLSRLSYDESKFDYRQLEFLVAQNFGQRTGAEVSYYDRRGGGGYTNSGVTGRQVHARAYHQFDNRRLVKLHFLNNAATLGEPFGYAAEDLALFSFNRYNAAPLEGSATRDQGYSMLALQYHQRKEGVEPGEENFRGGLYMNSANQNLTYSADTTAYKVRSVGANVHKWLDLGPLQAEGLARYEYFFNRDRLNSSFARSNWSLVSAEGYLRIHPFRSISLTGTSSWRMRSDGFTDYSLGFNAELIAGPIRIYGGGSHGTRMPTPQQLYWQSDEYSGNPALNRELLQEARAGLEIQPVKPLKIGGNVQGKISSRAAFLDGEGEFVNAPEYDFIAPEVYTELNSEWLETRLSAISHQFNMVTNPIVDPLQPKGDRLMLKGSAYWKGYVLSRAAYLKAGVSGVWSPLASKSDHYNPVLDYWQPVGEDRLIPWYSRLDLDISARVRSIVFVMRWENTLDGINQLGYFETAGYPMPGRRFLFGVRALFRN